MTAPEAELADDPRLARLRRDERGRPLLGGVALERPLHDSMGALYRGHHVELGVPVQVRAFPAHFADDRYRQIVEDARLLSRIRSPHVLAILGVGEAYGLRFTISELAPGGVTGSELLTRRERPLPERYARDIAIAATKGIVAAHSVGIVHRDVCPRNLLIPDDGPLSTTRLMDFGKAHHVVEGQSLPAATSGAVSTMEYTAPDQLDGRIDWTTDIYALGATLYGLLTGERAFPGESDYEILMRKVRDGPVPLEQRRANVSPALAEVVARCMRVASADRYATAQALLDALDGA
jgi:serine/threonine-protein kinase